MAIHTYTQLTKTISGHRRFFTDLHCLSACAHDTFESDVISRTFNDCGRGARCLKSLNAAFFRVTPRLSPAPAALWGGPWKSTLSLLPGVGAAIADTAAL